MTIATLPSERARAGPRAAEPGGPARLGPRLRALLALCPPQGPVADIGSGHGRLALELKRRDHRRQVFATEINPGPSGELRRLLGALSGVQILEGEGLRPLAYLGCRGVVIAGLGGVTIAQMLERDRVAAGKLEWLCLQPAQRAERLRGWLQAAKWPILEHRQVQEKGHLYQLFLVAPQ
ncbi:MAG TPA: tRNA (adenine(22)-N(1))-methyltransferase TrmK [Candidatus Dormibacteraeota bacterium]|nr:tRNA (adenine(22)-N(1))-methyltransferase TrmK [Candidatus Dormibacteraeota bacterium]